MAFKRIVFYFAKAMVKCITCDSASFDANYDEFIKKLEDVGIKQVLEEKAAMYDELMGN